MGEYIPITLTNGLNDVTYMNDGRITEVKWDIPIYLLRGNTYENIGTINDIRGRKNFNGISDANSILIGTVDELRTGRLFIRISEEEKIVGIIKIAQDDRPAQPLCCPTYLSINLFPNSDRKGLQLSCIVEIREGGSPTN